MALRSLPEPDERDDGGSLQRLFDLPADLTEAAHPLAGLDAIAARLDQAAAAAPGYVLRRILLVNYWHFDYEEITVPNGRLFLLGENGSGKSTILGATIPLLLDGAIRPERLDTFGSTHRKIDHYVLGLTPGGGALHQRRTSYVALEFAWRDGVEPRREAVGDAAHAAGRNGASSRPTSLGAVDLADLVSPSGQLDSRSRPRYLTVGICLAGNVEASETVRAFRFVITSGKRLGIDLPLKSAEGRVHDALYFRNTIREHGLITERAGEYREAVAEWLFGTKDARFLEHLVEVVLLLRQPSLASQLSTFNDVYGYLKRALPPLPDEITENTTEAFDRMDGLRRQGARLARQAEAAERVYAEDLALARARARRLAFDFIAADRAGQASRAVEAERRAALEAARAELLAAQTGHEQTGAGLAAAEAALADLRASAQAQEAETLERLLAQARSELELAGTLLARSQSLAAERERSQAAIRGRLAAQEQAWGRRREAATNRLAGLASGAREARWTQGAELVAAVQGELPATLPSAAEDGAADLAARAESDESERAVSDASHAAARLDELDRLAAERERALEDAGAVQTEHDRRAATERETIERLAAREAERAAATARVDEAEQALEAAWERLGERLATALEPELARLAGEASEGIRAAGVAHDAPRLRAELAAVVRFVGSELDSLGAEQDRLSRESGEVGRERREIERQIAALRATPELAPARSPHRAAARAALAAAGITTRPLYTLLDFAPDLPAERCGQAERMLLDAGLLDALVVLPEDEARAEEVLREQQLADCWIDSRSAPLGVTSAATKIPTTAAPDATAEAHSAGVESSAEETALIPPSAPFSHGEKGYGEELSANMKTAIGSGVSPEAFAVDPTVEAEGWRLAAWRALWAVASVGALAQPADRSEELTTQRSGEPRGERSDVSQGATVPRPGDPGTWRHGVLAGYAGPGEPLGLIGATNRQARRERELAKLAAARDELAARLAELAAAREARVAEQARLRRALAALQAAADEGEIGSARAGLAERAAQARRAEAACDQATAEVAARRAATQEAAAELRRHLAALDLDSVGEAAPDVPGVGSAPGRAAGVSDLAGVAGSTAGWLPDRALLPRLRRALGGFVGGCHALRADVERLAELSGAILADRAQAVELAIQVEAARADRAAAEERRRLAAESVVRWQERLESSDVAEFRRRLDAAGRETQALTAALVQVAEALGQARGGVASAERDLASAETARAAADAERGQAAETFVDLLRLSPDVAAASGSRASRGAGLPDGEASASAPGAASPDGSAAATNPAASLQDGAAAGDGNGELERAAEELAAIVADPGGSAALALARRLGAGGGLSRERLDREAERARDRRRLAFDEERSQLVDYDLFVAADERDRVYVRFSERVESTVADLLRQIQQRIAENDLLLGVEEERLFKDYLCDTGLSAIHKAVQAAERLVLRINTILGRTPLGHERYELKLEVHADGQDAPSPLARHHALFRRDLAAVTDDERKVLFEAVRGAVAEAHRRSEEGEGAFADILAGAFDYREWFTLALFVTDESGQRRRISSRTARTRSGAQQLFALYVPLFAALAALYQSVAPWAPRLFAMDEAFDKVSEDNVAVLLRFLVDLGFQWVVASPRLSGAGRDMLPACADWQLFHDATARLAQAVPVIYCAGELLDP